MGDFNISTIGGSSAKSLARATVTLASSSFVYDGAEKVQQVESVVLGGVTLREGVDYLVTGNRATNAGTHTLTVLGIMDYSGAAIVSWSIAKAQGSVSVSPASLSIQGVSSVATAQISVTGDGSLSASSGDSGVATAAISGYTLSVTRAGEGDTTITVTLVEGDNYLGATAMVAVSCSFVHIYGVSWDGTSTTAWTRTDDAADFTDPVPYVAGASSYGSPFDDRMPWSGMQIVEDDEAGTLVSIPKFWYTLTQNGAGMKIQIADMPLDGFHVSPAHMDRGDGEGERDIVYIGRYHCASTYKSTTGVNPEVSKGRGTFRSYIHNLGSTIWQADWAMRFTLWLLYLVEFADWNSQVKIGYGCGNNSGAQSMGDSDSMPYHTGTMQTSRTAYGVGVQYRHIEGLWDNVHDFVDGCINTNTSGGLKIVLNPANFDDYGSSVGINVGTPSSGYPSAFSVKNVGGAFPLFIPSEANGSGFTYSCDNWGFGASYPCVYAGGYYNHYLNFGMFYFSYNAIQNSYAYVGSRLMKLP